MILQLQSANNTQYRTEKI